MSKQELLQTIDDFEEKLNSFSEAERCVEQLTELDSDLEKEVEQEVKP